MTENNTNRQINGAKILEERLPELQPLFKEVEGKTGAKITTEIKNVGFGPAVEYIEITFRHESEDGEIEEDCYFAKKLVREEMQRYFPFLHVNTRGSQQKEFDLLKMYSNLKVNVPAPCLKAKDILASRKIKGESLENILSSKATEGERADLIKKVSLNLDNLHNAGERIQGEILNKNLEIGKKIIETAILLKQSGSYFASLAATNEELSRVKDSEGEQELIKSVKEKCSDNYSIFNSFFEVLGRHFSRQKTQLIHGDMTTYHVIIDENREPWFIDFGKPKFSNVVFDLIPLCFSQDTNLSIKAIDEIFREHLDRKYTPKDRIDEEFKSLYLGGCFSNIGRGSKNRILRVASPGEYSQFVTKHPSYDRSLIFYINSTREITEHLLNNKDRFKIENDDYQSIKNFSYLLDRLVSIDGYSFIENRCPMSLGAKHRKEYGEEPKNQA